MTHRPQEQRFGETPNLPPRRVLVAEDDPALRRLIVDALIAEGFEVSEARDGLELIEIAEASAREDGSVPELVVTDVRMPGMTGFCALEALRTLLAQTAVLVITAFSDDEARAEARRLGAVGVLDKPFELDDLLTAAKNGGRWSSLRSARDGVAR